MRALNEPTVYCVLLYSVLCVGCQYEFSSRRVVVIMPGVSHSAANGHN